MRRISCEGTITTGIHSNTPDNNSYKLQSSWYNPGLWHPPSDTSCWHCFSLEITLCISHAYHLQRRRLPPAIIVVIVSRQCSLFAFLMNNSHPPGFIIVQSGPEAGLCLVWAWSPPSSGNQGRSGSEESCPASDELVTRGRGRGQTHRGLIEYLYQHHRLNC